MLFAVHVSSDEGKDVGDMSVLNKSLVLQQFQDVFPTEISGFPPHRDLEFSIELVPGEAPASKTPYYEHFEASRIEFAFCCHLKCTPKAQCSEQVLSL